MKRLSLYLLRWQASTPILAFITWMCIEELGSIWSSCIANLVGGLIFYKIDKLIFNKK